MFNIVENALTGVVWARQGHVFDEFQWSRLMQWESVLEQIVKSLFLGTMFVVEMVDIVWKLMKE